MNVTGSLWSLVRLLLPPAVLALGVLGLMALVASRQPPKPREIETPAPLVETVPVGRTDSGLELKADGVVVPFREVTLAAQVEGRVIAKSPDLRAGRVVKAGTELLRIDPRDYELAVARYEQQQAQAEAAQAELGVQIANAEASIALAKQDVALQQGELKRIETLSGRGVSTASALDAARRAELASRTALGELENQKRLLEAQKARLEQAVKLAVAQLDTAKLDLERTVVTAPAGGVIVTADVELDGYVKKGEVVAVIEDTAAGEVRTNLDMRTLGFLRRQLPPEIAATLGPYDVPPVPVTVTYELLGNIYSWQGTLDRIEGVGVDQRTRTVPCLVRVNDPRAVSLRSGEADMPMAAPPALVRGMYVRVLLHSNPNEPFLSVPEAAVRPGNVVWAVRDGAVQEFKLPAARVTRGAVLVAPRITQLKAGDQVVVSPLPVAHDGMAVRVRGAASETEAGPGAGTGKAVAGEKPAKPVASSGAVQGTEVRR